MGRKGAISFAAVAMLASVSAASVPVWAQSVPPPAPAADKVKPVPVALPTLAIEPLTDRGGAATADPDGVPLFRGFAHALAVALQGEAQTAPLPFTVSLDAALPVVKPKNAAPPAPAPVPVPVAARFHLTGEISVAGADGPYLCSLRLTDAADKNRIVGQWAGVAQTLRDLTGNLAADRRVHPLGLAGEFARRVTDASRSLLTPATPGSHADDDAVFARCVAESSKTHRLAIEAVPEVAGKPLSPGAKFRLRVATQDAGDVYLFTIDGQNHPVAAFTQTDAPAALPGRPVLLPAAGTPFSLAADPVSGVSPTFVAILVRRPDASAAPAANPGAAASGSVRSEANPPPVVVVDASAKRPMSPTADPLVARLMALLKTKSAADVLAARLTVEAGK